MPKLVITEEQLKRLRSHAAEAWSEEEYDELYMDAVTCGNGDDSYSYGYDQGAAQLAEELLANVEE